MLNDPAQFRNIGCWLQHWANLSPDKVAFHFIGDDGNETGALSYLALLNDTQRVAHQLQQQAKPGDRVVLTYQPGLDFIVAFLGCVQAGLIAVPVYPPSSPKDWPRFVKIVLNSEARLVATTQQLAQLSQAAIAMTPELAGIELLSTDSLQAEETAPVTCSADANTLAFLQYTSGSTGNPKGVMLTHGNLYHNECLIKESFQLTSDAKVVCWLPQYHDMGLIGNILGTLFNGMTSILMSPLTFLKNPYLWLKTISDYRATHSGGPNFSYELCVKRIPDALLATLDLSCWQLAYNGAEPIRATTLQRFSDKFHTCGFQHTSFLPVYGLAESSLLVTQHSIGTPVHLFRVDAASLQQGQPQPGNNRGSAKTLVSSGRVLGQTLHIVNPHTGHRCADNEVGEIWVQGDSVAQGYWKNPEVSAATFAAYLTDSGEGPFMRTGDLGFLRDGDLFVTGRLKEMMIVDGRNLYPQDIEETIQSTSSSLRVGCGAVFSLDDEAVIAVQELSNRAEYSEQELAELAQSALRAVNSQHQLALKSLILIEQGSLQKTSSGKIRRTAMAQQYQNHKLKVVKAFTANDFFSRPEHDNRNVTSLSQAHYEAAILNVIATELGINAEQISPRMTFADFGLDSKTLVGLAGILEQKLKQPLPPQLFFDYPSISKLAEYLGGQGGCEHGPLATNPDPTKAQGDIAIIGIGCRFPGQADSAEAFWQILEQGIDTIAETPASRWSTQQYYDADILAPGKMATKWGGYLQRVKDFDAAFFGIKDKEATLLDPQQRILLETSWHALEHAGLTPESTAGKEVGVFVGVSNVDYDRHCSRIGACSEPYAGTGIATSIAANRLSYFYDWRGPSVALDTACSSSLVAIHQACNSLRQQECRLALAAGVNLILTPDLSITFSKSGMMAADGRCKTFDDSADGYVRSEGCGVVILKPLADAMVDGDQVIAVIKGSAVTQDGRSNGITAPNGPAQVKTIRRALHNAGLQPRDIQFVESHGTGTELGDPIELQALANAYSEQREHPLMVGAVKTNIGHLESAAGIAGVIKTALCLHKQLLPRNLHFNTPNQRFDWARHPIRVNDQIQPWLTEAGVPRRAGVSSFGFGGTNAHLILEEPPTSNIEPNPNPTTGSARLFCLSAKDRSGLQAQVRQYVNFLQQTDCDLQTLCISQNCNRTHFDERLALVADNVAELQQSLRQLNWANLGKNIFSSKRRPTRKRPHITWMFTGQGSQQAGMGSALYQHNQAFRQAVDHCHDLLRQYSSIDLKRFLLQQDDPQAQVLIHRTDHTQPVLFCYEYALAQLALDSGMYPDTVIGHSLGEIVAATIAGVFSLEDGLRIAVERGRLMQQLAEPGGMMAVFAHQEDVDPLLSDYPLVSIGALNGPGQVVLSGCEQSLRDLQQQFEERDIDTRLLKVSHGFHSPLMEPMLADFRKVLGTVTFRPPSIPLVSNVSAQYADAELASVEYWCRHVVATVNFLGGLQQIAKHQHGILVELGPKATLSAIAQRSLDRDSVRIIPLMREGQAEMQCLLEAIAQCYTSGMNIEWQRFLQVQTRPRLPLPLYPFQRKYYWLEGSWLEGTVSTSAQNQVSKAQNTFHPLLGQRQHSPYLKNGEMHFVAHPGLDAGNWASTFKQTDVIHFHLSHFLEMAMEVGHEAFRSNRLTLQDLELHRRMRTHRGDTQSIHTIVEQRANNELRVHFYTQENDHRDEEQWALLSSVSIAPSFGGRQPRIKPLEIDTSAAPDVDMSQFFQAGKAAHTVYCTNDKNVVSATQLQGNSMICEMDFSELIAGSTSPLWIKPEAMQALYQVVGFFCESLRQNDALHPGVEFTPYSVRSLAWCDELPAQGFIQLTHVGSWNEEAEHTELDVLILDTGGHCRMKIEGMLLRSRVQKAKTVAEKVREVGMEERIDIIRNLIAHSLASNLGGQAMDIDLNHSLGELGADSITVISTLSRLKSELKLEIRPGDLNKARSIEDFVILLAARLGNHDQNPSTQVRGNCAVMREGHAGVLPLFFVHPGNDGALNYLDMANAFGDDIPLYVMLPDLNEDHHPRTLNSVVDLLVNDIRAEQPHGPYMLAGWSLGATLAVLVANQLVHQGEEIKFVSVVDAPCLLGSSVSAQTLQYSIEQITAHQAMMSKQRAVRYKAELFELYSQALQSKPMSLTYELRHFQTGPTHENLIANAAAGEWNKLTSRKIHSQTIPGDHLSLFKSGNVETLASFLRKLVRSNATTSNRFLQTTLERSNLSQSVLTGTPERNEQDRPCATLRVDEDHPYFFDHELDHIPGILILAGAWELVCRSTQEYDPLNPLLTRSVGQCSLLFDRFAEKDRSLHYELQCSGGGAHSIQLECYINQGGQRIGTFFLRLDYHHRKPAMVLPATRQIMTSGMALLHKQIESNVLINQPEQSETRWECRPQLPEAGHYLGHTSLAYSCLNPIYVLEATRQFLTYLSHEQYGVAMGTHVNLIDIKLEFRNVIDFNADVRLVLAPNSGIMEQDSFQTITVLWQQNGSTVVSSQITAQVTRLETYTQQRAR